MEKPVKKPMRCKAYNLVIEVELQAVTCPGVWLCNNGKVTIQIYLLGLCTQTTALNPVFPLLCHEKFVFHKSFSNIKKLHDIDAKMSREIVYIELIQWEDCDTGNVLANFKTTLMELLYPYPNYRGVVAGTDVDLLMEPTKIFPGIIAPKIEVSTKFTLEEILCNIKDSKKNEVIVVNPKLISSKCVPRRCIPVHQKKVCHTNKYHKSKSQKPSRNKHFEQKNSNLHAPKPIIPCRQPFTKCACSNDAYDTNFMREKICQLRNCGLEPQCTCNINNKIPCTLCTRYKSYFSNTCNCCAPKLTAAKEHVKCCCCPRAKNYGGYHQTTVKQYKMCACEVSKPCSPRSVPQSCRQYLTSKPKLAAEIQEKLHQGLSTPRCSSNLSPRENSCAGTCDEGFYRDMEKFYKQLYLKAHYKLKNVQCNCNKTF